MAAQKISGDLISPLANASADADSASHCNSFRSRAQTSFHFSDPAERDRRFPYFIFDPDSSVVFYWTATVAMVTLYNSWIIILRIAFPEVRQQAMPSYLSYVDHLCDAIFASDIFVQLHTAYLFDGIPVFHPPNVRQHYTSQSYFVRDVIAVLPTEFLCSFLPEITGIPKHFLCSVGGARLSRLLKFHVIYKFYDLAESRTSNPHCIRVFRLSLSLMIIIHWIACFYYLVSEFEGLGSNRWVYTNAHDQQRFLRKYIVCFYWSAMTLTTIGNCNPPETDLEYIFTGVIFLTGVFVFATVLGNVGDVISSMNANRQEFQARMDHIKMYLTHKKVPAKLQLKIKKWAEYSWSRTKATDESRLLNMLPERLRAEVAVHVHLDSLKKVKIFEHCENGFLCELVLKLRSQVFSPGDYICKIGETGREMFIINHGKVEVLIPSPVTNNEIVVSVLSVGNYFGEISLLRLDGIQNRRTADVRSIGYSELLCLSRRDLMAALVEYPDAKSILECHAKQRMKTSLQAQRAFSVDTMLRSSQEGFHVDNGLLCREDSRGKDVSEIKAMIEELKSATKVPGKTIWQLIARCEVLQAKVNEKETEIQGAKQRIADLESLLASRFHATPRRSYVGDGVVNSGVRVTKQFSQEEGRYKNILKTEETVLQRNSETDYLSFRPRLLHQRNWDAAWDARDRSIRYPQGGLDDPLAGEEGSCRLHQQEVAQRHFLRTSNIVSHVESADEDVEEESFAVIREASLESDDTKNIADDDLDFRNLSSQTTDHCIRPIPEEEERDDEDEDDVTVHLSHATMATDTSPTVTSVTDYLLKSGGCHSNWKAESTRDDCFQKSLTDEDLLAKLERMRNFDEDSDDDDRRRLRHDSCSSFISEGSTSRRSSMFWDSDEVQKEKDADTLWSDG